MERTIKDMTYEELIKEWHRLDIAIKELPSGCRIRNHYELRLSAVKEELGDIKEIS